MMRSPAHDSTADLIRAAIYGAPADIIKSLEPPEGQHERLPDTVLRRKYRIRLADSITDCKKTEGIERSLCLPNENKLRDQFEAYIRARSSKRRLSDAEWERIFPYLYQGRHIKVNPVDMIQYVASNGFLLILETLEGPHHPASKKRRRTKWAQRAYLYGFTSAPDEEKFPSLSLRDPVFNSLADHMQDILRGLHMIIWRTGVQREYQSLGYGTILKRAAILLGSYWKLNNVMLNVGELRAKVGGTIYSVINPQSYGHNSEFLLDAGFRHFCNDILKVSIEDISADQVHEIFMAWKLMMNTIEGALEQLEQSDHTIISKGHNIEDIDKMVEREILPTKLTPTSRLERL